MKKLNPIGVIFIGVILTSCAARTQSPTYLAKYQEAEAYYRAKDYYEASQLYKEIMPLLKGKKESIQAHFNQAYAHFYQKDYRASASFFKNFHKTYPRLPQSEEAFYMHGYALYLLAPEVELDQRDTGKAIHIFQHYVDKYPTGPYREVALTNITALHNKLAQKAFINAKLYYKLSYYQAAVIALTNFQEDFPKSPYQEESIYLKVDAQSKCIKKNRKQDQENKLHYIVIDCRDFLETYPNSQHIPAIKAIHTRALIQLEQTIQPKTP